MDAHASTEQLKERSETTGSILRWILVSGVAILVLATGLFASSGRLDWIMAWVYIGLLAVIQVATAFILISNNSALLVERSWVQKGSKDWDKVLVGLGECGLLGAAIVAGLDARFRWSPLTPLVFQMIALAIAVMGFSLFLWAMASNRFFSAYVRIQTDRGHTAVTGGPYQYVRHPGYVGGILVYLTTPVILGSLWALIPAMLIMIITVIRTVFEDRTLQQELEGYKDYARQVRYRLLPGIW